MEKVLLIGIGAGDPSYVTAQAVEALNSVDVFFVLEKAAEQDDLVALRREIVDRYVKRPFRFVVADDPPRGRDVEAWRAARADLVAGLLETDGVGAFLVWGDPSLYDGMIDLMERLAVPYEVIPGISAVSALAARHRVVLNRVAGDVLITTGRRVAAGLPDGARDVVVMLDSGLAFTALEGDWEIYWGAYLGTPDEILIAGRLSEVADEIVRVRAEARARKGWMFDTYLLRR
ncbi:precorrin-6A synthase (deacetylating) [Solirubrobacter soli]|uniref:precorrin-6A synthase (deacetylating) n=1 Tax=Solirubrobacter soli TaxID=363832 RepID=UPI000485321B|nr:precorrin-6A synthase (deacetylating) [Solirubrobacter soli]